MARNIVAGREVARFISEAMDVLVKQGESLREWLFERMIITHDSNPGNRGPRFGDWAEARERKMRGVIILRKAGPGGDTTRTILRMEFRGEFLVYRDRTSLCISAVVTPLGQFDEDHEEVMARAKD